VREMWRNGNNWTLHYPLR